MSSERISQQRFSQQPTEQKEESSDASKEASLEVANIPSGAMMDNVMRTRDENHAASPPEFVPAKFVLVRPEDEYEREADRLAKPANPLKLSATSTHLENSLSSQRKIPFNTLTTESQSSLQRKAEAFGEIWQPSLQDNAKADRETEK